MEIKFSPAEATIFKKIGEAAGESGNPVYVIGGFVRDKILGTPDKDIDVVCLGDGIMLAKRRYR